MHSQKYKTRTDTVTYGGKGYCQHCRETLKRNPGAKVRDGAYFDDNGQECFKCKQYKPFADFTLNKKCRSGYNTTCKRCKIFWIHNITEDDFNNLLERQGNVCAICRRTKKESGSAWHIDHDHSCCGEKGKKACGKCIRGILCGTCNSAIGMMADDIDRLKNAIAYLSGDNK